MLRISATLRLWSRSTTRNYGSLISDIRIISRGMQTGRLLPEPHYILKGWDGWGFFRNQVKGAYGQRPVAIIHFTSLQNANPNANMNINYQRNLPPFDPLDSLLS